MRKKSCNIGYLIPGVLFLSIALIIFTFFSGLEIYRIKTVLMAGTITPGNRVLVSKTKSFSTEYTAGNIISFKNSDTDSAPVFVKRVVAMSYDTIFADRDGLIINGKSYSFDPITYSIIDIPGRDISIEDIDFSLYFKYLLHATNPVLSERKTLFTNSYLIIPDGYYFVVGDNYNESMDSRFWGFIEKRQIIGKVLLIF